MQFRDEPPANERGQGAIRAKRLQEKIDVHAMLFRRAWELDEDGF